MLSLIFSLFFFGCRANPENLGLHLTSERPASQLAYYAYSDLVVRSYNGHDARTFDNKNTYPGTNQLTFYDNSYSSSSTSALMWDVLVSVSSDNVVQARREYGSSASLTIPTGGYVLAAHGTSIDFLSQFQVGTHLYMVPKTSCSPHTSSVPVVNFHQIEDSTGSGTHTQFDAQLSAISAAGYNTISIDDLLDYLHNNGASCDTTLPDNPIVLTFDDGYTDQVVNAPGILASHGMIGNFYIIGYYPGHYSGYATWDQIRTIAALSNVTIQCHSYGSHSMYTDSVTGTSMPAYMAHIGSEGDAGRASRRYTDMVACQNVLISEVGISPRTIAWPFGGYDEQLVKFAYDAGFEGMLTTTSGLNDVDNDDAPGHIRRFGEALSSGWTLVESDMSKWYDCP